MFHSVLRKKGTGLALCVILSLSPPAMAQIFSDSAAREKTIDNENEIKNIKLLVRDFKEQIDVFAEQNVNTRKQITALSQKIQKIEDQLRSLRGGVEEIGRLSDEAGDQRLIELKTTGITLGKDISRLDGAVAELRQQMKELLEFAPRPSEDELYVAAYGYFQQQEYGMAAEKFKQVLNFYPDGQFNINSRYWLGQSYLLTQDYPAAQEAAQALLSEHPQSDREAAAMLIIGQALLGMGDQPAAMAQLEYLVTRHPTSLAADQARQLLAQ